MKLAAKFFIILLHLTRPLNHIILGPGCCRFAISCTDFALEQLQQQPFFRAIWAICKRILLCNPFSKKTF